MNVSLSIDDFGTGYSSMSYLKTLPVKELKIDRSFVMGMANDPDSAVIVRSAVDLGHNLGMTVVAEGVEDDIARGELADMGCDLVQGYQICRPIPARELELWIETGPVTSSSPPPSADGQEKASGRGRLEIPIPRSTGRARACGACRGGAVAGSGAGCLGRASCPREK
jgi:predicted signal transduction protein with EAL and GGDEF domain